MIKLLLTFGLWRFSTTFSLLLVFRVISIRTAAAAERRGWEMSEPKLNGGSYFYFESIAKRQMVGRYERPSSVNIKPSPSASIVWVVHSCSLRMRMETIADTNVIHDHFLKSIPFDCWMGHFCFPFMRSNHNYMVVEYFSGFLDILIINIYF